MRSVDTQTLELANYFLRDFRAATPEMRDELAELIQRTVENWIEFGDHTDELRAGGPL